MSCKIRASCERCEFGRVEPSHAATTTRSRHTFFASHLPTPGSKGCMCASSLSRVWAPVRSTLRGTVRSTRARRGCFLSLSCLGSGSEHPSVERFVQREHGEFGRGEIIKTIFTPRQCLPVVNLYILHIKITFLSLCVQQPQVHNST